MKRVLCGVIAVVMMATMMCSCSSSKIPAGIYVWSAPDGTGQDQYGFMHVYCVFSDGKVSENWFRDHSTDVFDSYRSVVEDEKADEYYWFDGFKYKDGKLVSTETSHIFFTQISSDPNEFDGKEESEVWDIAMKRFKLR